MKARRVIKIEAERLEEREGRGEKSKGRKLKI
jgi:hypothetical protein